MQVSHGDTAVAGLFHELVHAAPGYERLYPRGLEPDKVYSVLSRRQLLNAMKFGGLLRHVLPIRVKPDGAVVRAAGKMYRMNDAVRECDATGAALMSGMSLNARFMGTGYDPGMRMQGDFSSNIYVITMEET